MTSVTNDELARVFKEVADGLLYRGDAWFKVRAYLDFVALLGELDRPVGALSSAELAALPGVGKAIHEKTTAYLAEGTFPLLERVRAEVDLGVRTLLEAGVPPSTARHLRESLDVRDLEDLISRHRRGELDASALPRRQRADLRAFLAGRDAS